MSNPRIVDRNPQLAAEQPAVENPSVTIDLTTSHSIDISQRDDVHQLKSNAVGLGGVLFAALAGAAPITAMLGNVPFGVGSGNGKGIPGAFMFATVVLTIFSVGYVAMARKVTAVGGFYSFISHGLGRVMGLGAGLVGALAYGTIVASLLGGMAYFAQSTVNEKLGVLLPWPVFALIGLALVLVLSYLDVDLSLKVLGAAMAAEVLILLIMDLAILFKGGHPQTGLNTESINVVSAFRSNGGGAAALGIFMAFWSWVGFEACPNYAEESRDPVKNVPRATYIAVISLGIFYSFTAWMVVSAWGSDAEVVAAGKTGSAMFYGAATQFAGKFVSDVMGWLVITGSFAGAMAFHNAAQRYWYSMGREGILPKALGKTHHERKTPYLASIFQTGVSFALIATFMFFGQTAADSNADKAQNGLDYGNHAAYLGLYTQLALLATFLILILQTLVSIAIPIYFSKHHPAEFRSKILQVLVCPIIAAIAQAGVIYLLISNLKVAGGTTGLTPFVPIVGFGILFVGFAGALIIRATRPGVYANVGRFVQSVGVTP